jgi:hypothetical protein
MLINNLTKINRFCNLHINSGDVLNTNISNVYKEIYNKDDLVSICLKYNNLSQFIKDNRKIYEFICRSKRLNELTGHMNRKVKWNIDLAEKEIQKYNTISDFREKSRGCYIFIMRNNLHYLLFKLSSKIKKRNLEESISELKINNYRSKYDLRKNNNALYCYLKKKIGLSRIGEIIDNQKDKVLIYN